MRALKELTSILYKSKIQITQNTHQRVDREKCNFHTIVTIIKKLDALLVYLQANKFQHELKTMCNIKSCKIISASIVYFHFLSC
jgi:hypothetical protein